MPPEHHLCPLHPPDSISTYPQSRRILTLYKRMCLSSFCCYQREMVCQQTEKNSAVCKATRDFSSIKNEYFSDLKSFIHRCYRTLETNMTLRTACLTNCSASVEEFWFTKITQWLWNSRGRKRVGVGEFFSLAGHHWKISYRTISLFTFNFAVLCHVFAFYTIFRFIYRQSMVN